MTYETELVTIKIYSEMHIIRYTLILASDMKSHLSL